MGISRRAAALFWLLPAMAPAALTAVTLTRAPYLQRISKSEAIVRWRTDVATPGSLQWGNAPGALTNTVYSGTATTEHRLVISGLSPRQLVYYAVGDGNVILAGNDEAHRFRAARAPGDWGLTRVLALGDAGTGTADQLAVRDGFGLYLGGQPPDITILLGDNAYTTGTDAEYTQEIFTVYPETFAASCLWPALGNHDALSADSTSLTGPYFDSFSLPRNGEAGGRASGTEAWYSYDIGQIHFIVLDSADSDLEPGAAMWLWLDADLAENQRPWTIAYFHHPPYTKGSHDSDDPLDSEGRMTKMRERALPILEAHGIDLVLSGHSHSYERSFLIDGHYGTTGTFQPSMLLDDGDGDPGSDGAYRKQPGPHGGTVYVVAGTSGRVAGTIEPQPAMAVRLSLLGSLVIDVHDNVLDGYFVGTDGLVADHFRLLDGDMIFADSFETGDVSAWAP